MKEYIKKASGVIIGSVETDGSGNKTVRDFSGRILGYYKKSYDTTNDFSGRIVARGDCAVAFLFCDLGRLM